MGNQAMEPWSEELWSNCKSKRVEDRLCSRRIVPRVRHSTKADMICASPKSQIHHQGGEGGMVGPAPKGLPLPAAPSHIRCPSQPWVSGVAAIATRAAGRSCRHSACVWMDGHGLGMYVSRDADMYICKYV